VYRPWHQLEASGQLHAPVTLPPGKDPLVATGYKVHLGPQSWYGRHGEEDIFSPAGTVTTTPLLSRPQPVTVPTVVLYL
jgi:hypothetical protein